MDEKIDSNKSKEKSNLTLIFYYWIFSLFLVIIAALAVVGFQALFTT